MKIRALKRIDMAIGAILCLLPRSQAFSGQPRPRTILIIKLSAMGDILCLMPSVRMLANAFPSAKLDWLTTVRASPELFRPISFVNEILILPTSFIGLFGFLLRDAWRLRRYDLIIDFDQYYRVSEVLARLGKISAGFHAPLKGKTFSIQKGYQAELNERHQFAALTQTVLQNWGLSPKGYNARLLEILSGHEAPIELRKLSEQLKGEAKDVLVVYPGSGKGAEYRRWGWDRFRKIIEEFQDRISILVAGGMDELDMRDAIDKEDLKVTNFINYWSLQDWIWLLSQIRPVVIGNDGGFLHIAEAAGIPTIGIFGPSRFSKWGSINPDSVGIEIETDLDCRPCLLNFLGQVPERCWKGTTQCLVDIRPNTVIDIIDAELKKREQSKNQEHDMR